MPTFNWEVDAKPVEAKKPRVSNIKFGDGYEQRATYGINTNPKNWDVSFNNRTSSEGAAIDAFFDALGGTGSFDWTPPGSVTAYKFKCQEWTKVPGPGELVSISAKFEQVFDP